MIREYNNCSLRARNSFGVDAAARRLVEFDNTAEIAEWLAAHSETLSGLWVVLGGGNNVLFTSDFDGTLLHIADRTQTITAETDSLVCFSIAAGAIWDEVVAWSCARGLWGAENLSGIPSSVGAAPVQNIGAYGAEISEIIESVDVLDVVTLKTMRIAAAHCGFGYRDSIFKGALRGKVIILGVNFRFSKLPQPKLGYEPLSSKFNSPPLKGCPKGGVDNSKLTSQQIRNVVLEIRDSKLPDPAVLGNAGSFFKNPVVSASKAVELQKRYPSIPIYDAAGGQKKLSAGWLIEQVGWKGKRIGEVGIYERQALVVVNYGNATGADIIAFAHTVSDAVNARFGVPLDPEVNIVP